MNIAISIHKLPHSSDILETWEIVDVAGPFPNVKRLPEKVTIVNPENKLDILRRHTHTHNTREGLDSSFLLFGSLNMCFLNVIPAQQYHSSHEG